MTENDTPQGATNPGDPQHPGQHPTSSAPHNRTDAFGQPLYPHQQPYGQSQPPRVPHLPQNSAARKRRMWPAVVGTAAVTALLVGGGTAAGTIAFLHDDDGQSVASSVDALGKSQPISVTSVDEANWEQIAAQVAPSVVAIEFRTKTGGGEGSGVVIDTDGHILTNDHVVAPAADGNVQVTLSDGRLYEAKIVGLDSSTDLAVIKLVDPPADLTPAAFANSDDVVVGNAVMAVGNPLGLANTVTTGIVSAVSRPVSTASEKNAQDVVVTNAIQIDAAVNPGNSGGPLFNAQGEVIGITSSIASLSGGSKSAQAGSIGLGFAIPANLASAVSDQLMEDGSAEHAFLGVGLSDGTASTDDVTRRGAKVENVTPGSPAADAGIKVGDVIVAFDGHTTSGFESLTAYVRERVSGDKATVTLVRSGASQDIEVTLAAKEDAAPAAPNSDQQQSEPGQSEQPQQGDTDPGAPPGEFFDWFFNQEK